MGSITLDRPVWRWACKSDPIREVDRGVNQPHRIGHQELPFYQPDLMSMLLPLDDYDRKVVAVTRRDHFIKRETGPVEY